MLTLYQFLCDNEKLRRKILTQIRQRMTQNDTNTTVTPTQPSQQVNYHFQQLFQITPHWNMHRIAPPQHTQKSTSTSHGGPSYTQVRPENYFLNSDTWIYTVCENGYSACTSSRES